MWNAITYPCHKNLNLVHIIVCSNPLIEIGLYKHWIQNIYHYGDVIMGMIGSQITSLTIVNSTVYSDADQRKHQSSASLAFVWGIHRDRWIPRTKGQQRGKCFHLMTSSCDVHTCWATLQCKAHLSRYRNCLIFIMWIHKAEKYILHIETPLRYPNRVAISTQVNTRAMLNAEIPSATKISKHTEGWDCETVRTMKQSMSSWLLCIYSKGLCIYSGGKTWQNKILTYN